jgi:hypothetical protein
VPQAVVDHLEVVQVEEQAGHRRVVGTGAVGRAQAGRHLLLQGGAVGQARQRVVPGLAGQLHLEGAAVGEVLHGAHEAGAVPGARGGRQADEHPALLPVGADQADLRLGGLAGQGLLRAGEDVGQVLTEHARGPRQAQQLLVRDPEELAEGVVDVGQAQAGLGDDRRHRAVAHERLEAALLRARLLLGEALGERPRAHQHERPQARGR